MTNEKDEYLNVIPFIPKEESGGEEGEMGDLNFCIEYFRDCAETSKKTTIDDTLNEILKNGLEIFSHYVSENNKLLLVDNLLKAYYIVKSELVKE